MPPLIRRQPLSERIKALLNPYDFLLWLSEELHESALDEKLKDWTVPIGVALNLVYMVARANSANDSRGRRDDVFGDFEGRGGSGWFTWFASFTAHLLAILSVGNALYTFTRTRKYRLFESNVEVPPSTPSARRVKVDSSPMSNSPLSYFSAKLAANTASSRAHPDEKSDVWELAIWDPKPLHLSLFCLFSPGHVLVYWIFLPTSSLDPRPSVTVMTTLLLAVLLSAQLLLYKSFFERKASDDKILHKEVLNEYDTKYVHPSLNRPVRDVGTQSIQTATSPGRTKTREVDVYTPTTIVNRGWKINPNPSYAAHLGDNVDPQKLYAETPGRRVSRRSSALLNNSPTPMTNSGYTSSSSTGGQASSRDTGAGPDYANISSPKPLPRQPSYTSLTPQPQPQPSQPRDRTSTFPRSDGGSLGVFSHAASPLRKSSSVNLLGPRGRSREFEGRAERTGSPLKRVSTSAAAPAFGAARTGGRLSERVERGTERAAGREFERAGRDHERGTERADDGLRVRLDGLRRDSRPY